MHFNNLVLSLTVSIFKRIQDDIIEGVYDERKMDRPYELYTFQNSTVKC